MKVQVRHILIIAAVADQAVSSLVQPEFVYQALYCLEQIVQKKSPSAEEMSSRLAMGRLGTSRIWTAWLGLGWWNARRVAVSRKRSSGITKLMCVNVQLMKNRLARERASRNRRRFVTIQVTSLNVISTTARRRNLPAFGGISHIRSI